MSEINIIPLHSSCISNVIRVVKYETEQGESATERNVLDPKDPPLAVPNILGEVAWNTGAGVRDFTQPCFALSPRERSDGGGGILIVLIPISTAAIAVSVSVSTAVSPQTFLVVTGVCDE